jgi:hypothetical protein
MRRMNAWVTKITTFWLMGKSEITDVELPDGTVGVGYGLKVMIDPNVGASGWGRSLMWEH